MAAIPAFAKLIKDGDGPAIKRVTIFGVCFGFLVVFYFVFGIKNLVDEKVEEQESKNKIDSLSINMNYVKGTSDSYYNLLQTLGYKIDTTQKDAKKNADSLMAVIRLQKTRVEVAERIVPRLELCADQNNLSLKKLVGDSVQLLIGFCSNKTIHSITVNAITVMKQQGKFILLPMKKGTLMKSNVALNPGEVISPDFHFLNVVSLDKDTMYMFFKGTYKDDQNQLYHYKRIVRKTPSLQQFQFLNNYAEVEVIKFLQMKKLW